jgi:CheY-like chemotaxis protein
MKALIIDDEKGGILLADFFEMSGWECVNVDSGEEALELLKSQSFDVAIVDIRLPGMDGEQFILKASEAFPKLTCLVCTGFVNYELSADLLKAGLTSEHVVSKPVFDMDKLRSHIEALVEQRRSEG